MTSHLVSTARRLRLAMLALCLFALPATAVGGENRAPDWAYTTDATLPQRRAELLALLGVADWHAHGHRGAGVTVAVLDSGFRGYRDHLGKSLPPTVTAKSFRRDGNLEAKDSQHGILCGEVIHALAPEAELLFANWEPQSPESFIAAVRWARSCGAKVISCSVISPSWSDGEGGGPVHRQLREALGDGDNAGDVLLFASAGNVAARHWTGPDRPAAAISASGPGWHQWQSGVTANPLKPWGTEEVTVEVCWSDPATSFRLEVTTDTGDVVAKGSGRGGRTCTVARFTPTAGRSYAVRLRREGGTPGGTFHMTALSADLGVSSAGASVSFPGDGPEVIAVGAVELDGRRAWYSACGPNSTQPKPDVVAPVPFGSYFRSRPFAGTSAAAPQAAALATLISSRHPDWTANHVRGALTAAAHDLGPTGHDPEFGYGRVSLPAEGGPGTRLVTAPVVR